MKGIMMITWLLLVSLFCKSTQNGNGQENAVLHCGLQNLTDTGVFPKDHSFTVGNNVTFCCVLPAGEVFKKMNLNGYSNAIMQTTKISNQIYTLTVYLNQPSTVCFDVICESESESKNKTYGACTYIGYPPDVSGLQCETQDLESVHCHWTETENADSTKPTVYRLLGGPCTNQSKGSCLVTNLTKHDVIGERKWTMTALNRFGTTELSETADLSKRVRMFAPEEVKASSVNARNVSLEWRWKKPVYNDLNITCQVNIGHAENTISENFGVGLRFVVLNDLIPNWTYNVKVRCGTTQHFWKWSDWSSIVTIHTKGDVPDALDVWMQMKDNNILIIWKIPLAKSHGNIKDYEVTWTKATEREQQNRTTVGLNKHSLALSLDTSEEYIVTVTARNINGSSSPSTITIPSLNPDRTRVKISRITGSNGSFDLSWSASPISSCGYIVDWCLTVGCGIVEWMKVPPNETKASISSKNFKAGLRYSLSIHACTQGAPVLLEKREGYIKEERIQDGLFKPLKGNQQNYDFVVSWDRISLREQTTFIYGYVLYCFDNDNIVCNVSTEDPDATSLTARNLKVSSYTFTVKAQTAVGECGDSSTTATMNSLIYELKFKAVFIALVTVFVLLSLITVLFYRHWTCIKQKVFPPIPKPVLTSPDEHRCRPLLMDQCHNNEADIVDCLEIRCSAGAPMNGYTSQTNTPFVFAQIQPLKKCAPPPLTLPTTAIPCESGLPSSPFRSVFPNPSYNLTIQQGYHSNSGSEPQERKSLERSSSGYHPQDYPETTMKKTEEDAQSLLSCVSTYILLPQSPSR